MNLNDFLCFTDDQIVAGGCVNTQSDSHPRVYFLIKGGVVIYVGQTINLGARVSDHKRSKDFDEISFLSVPKNLVNDVEAKYIIRFDPEENSALHSNTLYCGKGRLKSLVKDQYERSIQMAVDSMEVAYVSRTKHVKYVTTIECIELSGKINQAIKKAINGCLKTSGE